MKKKIILYSMMMLCPSLVTGEVETVKAVLLVGQSNMQGHGHVKTLDWLGKDSTHRHLLDAFRDDTGKWTSRDDVFIHYQRRDGDLVNGGLRVGCGASNQHIGPELMLGRALGEHYKEPVLLIKTAWGGKSLAEDFRPPSMGAKGVYFQKMEELAKPVLGSPMLADASLKGKQVELIGLVWFQGWNDMVDAKKVAVYSANMSAFIRDARKAFDKPNLPVVIGTLGVNGKKASNSRLLAVRKAQSEQADKEEFKGTVGVVATENFWDEQAHSLLTKGWINRRWKSPEMKAEFEKMASQPPYHYLGSAKIMSLIGDAMGKQLIELQNDEQKK